MNSEQFPSYFTVLRSVPNPFTHSVKIGYGLPLSGRVTVEIFDVAGRRVARLVDSQQPPGYHSVIWDGKDAQGRKTAAGIYFYRVRFNGQHDVKKMIHMK
jgi:flagellar hook assembly protein FlgD